MAILGELWAHFCLVSAMLDYIHSATSCSLLPGRHIEPSYVRDLARVAGPISSFYCNELCAGHECLALQETNETTTRNKKFCITVKVFHFVCTVPNRS